MNIFWNKFPTLAFISVNDNLPYCIPSLAEAEPEPGVEDGAEDGSLGGIVQ